MVDRPLRLLPGVPMLLAVIVAFPATVALAAVLATMWPPYILFCIPLLIGWFICLFGFKVVSPNETKVVQLFGKYVGNVTDVGLFWGNPLYWATSVSQRLQTFETGQTNTPERKDAAGKVYESATRSRQPSKVNDRDGTPIEIAAVVVWKAVRPGEAVFAVQNYVEFVYTQSEAALRNLASLYSYDPHGEERSLRGHTKEVAEELKRELHERLDKAGVEVVDARISHLAYAPEIASAMLQRQQATATVAARQIIVANAVGMVEMALAELQSKGIVDFDPERRQIMVSNLLVVLCSHSGAQPVINTGMVHP